MTLTIKLDEHPKLLGPKLDSTRLIAGLAHV